MKEGITKIHGKVNTILNEEYEKSKENIVRRRDWLGAYWSGFKSPEQISRIRNTGYDGYCMISVLSAFDL